MELVLPAAQRKLETDEGASGPAVVSVLSGKGGVGKTIVSGNLAVVLASKRRSVLLVDCDLSAGQTHLVLGVCPSCGLAQVVRGTVGLRHVIVRAGEGLLLVPGGPPGGLALEIGGEELRAIVAEARSAVASAKAVILDAGPGAMAACGDFASVADLPLVLTTPEPTSIRATVALIEAMLSQRPETRPCVVVNMAASEDEAVRAFEKIKDALVPVFAAEPELAGWLPHDLEVARSLRRYRPIVQDSPGSSAAVRLRELGEALAWRLGLGGVTVAMDQSERPEQDGPPEGEQGVAGEEQDDIGEHELDNDGEARAA